MTRYVATFLDDNFEVLGKVTFAVETLSQALGYIRNLQRDLDSPSWIREAKNLYVETEVP